MVDAYEAALSSIPWPDSDKPKASPMYSMSALDKAKIEQQQREEELRRHKLKFEDVLGKAIESACQAFRRHGCTYYIVKRVNASFQIVISVMSEADILNDTSERTILRKISSTQNNLQLLLEEITDLDYRKFCCSPPLHGGYASSVSEIDNTGAAGSLLQLASLAERLRSEIDIKLNQSIAACEQVAEFAAKKLATAKQELAEAKVKFTSLSEELNKKNCRIELMKQLAVLSKDNRPEVITDVAILLDNQREDDSFFESISVLMRKWKSSEIVD